jgi:hypothetical protein
MTTTLAPTDALAESQRLIAALESRRDELPFADTALATHRTLHQELEATHSSSAQAVAEWRAALAQRWDCEVAALRLYKQAMRQLLEHYGSREAGPVKLLSRGGAEAESTPAELLEDLRRLAAVLAIDGVPADAAACIPQVEAACLELARAIGHASAAEHRRRQTLLDHRMVRAVYQRARDETGRALAAHYGQIPADVFAETIAE